MATRAAAISEIDPPREPVITRPRRVTAPPAAIIAKRARELRARASIGGTSASAATSATASSFASPTVPANLPPCEPIPVRSPTPAATAAPATNAPPTVAASSRRLMTAMPTAVIAISCATRLTTSSAAVWSDAHTTLSAVQIANPASATTKAAGIWPDGGAPVEQPDHDEQDRERLDDGDGRQEPGRRRATNDANETRASPNTGRLQAYQQQRATAAPPTPMAGCATAARPAPTATASTIATTITRPTAEEAAGSPISPGGGAPSDDHRAAVHAVQLGRGMRERIQPRRPNADDHRRGRRSRRAAPRRRRRRAALRR